MRILQYNILDGCGGDPDRLSRLGDWLTGEAFDLVGLNELNGWTPTSIAELAASWGYTYSAIPEIQTSPYRIGVLANHPLRNVTCIDEGFHHGVLTFDVMGIHVVITHLTPLSAHDREAEAAHLASIVAGLDGPALLMGDLNTLSPRDREWHESSGIGTILQEDDRLARKFLNRDGSINYRPMQLLLDAGLIDLCSESEATVPTAMNEDPAHAVPMRLDYMMGNRQLLADQSVSARVVRTPPLPHLSDHFPVLCEW